MIIAEISQNFTCLAEAKELVRLAKENGADLAKAQLFDSMKLYGKKVPAELSFCDAKALFNYGASIGIEVFFSVFDVERVQWCEEIGVKRYKVAHSQRHNIELRNVLAGREIFLSTSDVIWLEAQNLYCVPHYPTHPCELRFTDRKFEEENGGEYPAEYDGFSDHTLNLTASKVAISRGAQIIEKHFAIDHNTGVDAPWSMTPEELRELKRWETVVKQVL